MLWVLEVRERFLIRELTSACSASYFSEMGLLSLHVGIHLHVAMWQEIGVTALVFWHCVFVQDCS